MRFTKQPQTEPIPGYRLLEPMGRGGFGEVWKCEAPGGLLKAIKFVFGDPAGLHPGRAPAEEELDAIQRVKAVRHPFLLSMERVERVGGELIIVMELADRSLHDRLHECTQSGLTGIPREELLAYLTEAAEALDLMNFQHNLQHLDIKPHNLFLVSNHVKVGDFGLVQGMSGRTGKPAGTIPLGAVTPLYASPETFLGMVSPHSDQYSLAIVYQELLTRTLPFTGKNARQLLMLHTQGEPDLHAVPEWDRPAVAKALSKDPKARFPSCGHFVRALASGWIPNQLALVANVSLAESTPALHLPAETAGPTEALHETAPHPATAPRAAAPPRPQSLAGHELMARVSTGPFREVWRARAPDGSSRLVTQVFGWPWHGEAALEDAVARWQAVRHPVLLEPEVLTAAPGRLVFATDAVERSLRDRLHECREQGLSGIPRAELLGYLGELAAALDELDRVHRLAHLGLTPRHLLLDAGRVYLAEFGLAQLFWPADDLPGPIRDSRYAAPELAGGKIGPLCDQFSLGLIWCEMLTGTAPPRAGRGTQTLSDLPESDRAAVARALDRAPEKRWPSCTDFTRALGGTAPASATGAAGRTAREQPRRPRAAVPAGQVLRGRFSANLTAETTRPRLEGFRQQWNGELLRAEDDRYVFRMTMLGTLWQRCLGRQPGLEVEVGLRRTAAPPGAPTEIAVEIRPVSCGQEQGARFLEEMGNLLFESLQAHLHAVPQRRAEERLPWHYALQVRPVLASGELGEPITCQGKDISLNGIGFYTPQELPAGQVSLVLPQTPQTPRVTALANVVRVQRCGAGWFEVGAVLLTPAPREEPAAEPAQASLVSRGA